MTLTKNNTTPPIILIGMPGSGKSTLGRIIAKELNKVFVDGDDHIQKMSGEDSATAFEWLTYEQWLQKESEYLSTIETQDSVIALPGSAWITTCSRYMLRRWNGKILQIVVDPTELEHRLEHRPDGISRIQFGAAKNITELLQIRQWEYDKLTPVKVDITGLSIEASVQEILARSWHQMSAFYNAATNNIPW